MQVPAVVKAGSIFARDAIFTSSAASVYLNGDPLTDLKLVNRRTAGHHCAGIFMADNEISKGRLVGHSMGNYFNVCSTDAAGVNLYQDLISSRGRNIAVLHPDVIEAV